MNIDVLSQRITEAILSDTYLTFDNVHNRVKSILLIWFPAITAPKQAIKSTDKFIRASERKRIELNFWKEKARGAMSAEEIKNAYAEIDSILNDNGFII